MASILGKSIPGLAILALMAFSACRSSTPAPQFKIQTAGDTVYRVAFEDLPKAFRNQDRMPIAKMGLFLEGEPIPLWVEPGEDQLFGPGDTFEFLAKRLHGDLAYHNEYSRQNAYHLRFDVDQPKRLKNSEAAAFTLAGSPSFSGNRHMEVDKLLMRFASYDLEPHEMWYWQKLSCTDRNLFTINFELKDALPNSAKRQLHLNLRGWSRIRGKGLEDIPDHELRVQLDDFKLGPFHWEDREPKTLVIDLPQDLPLGTREHQLTLQVPRRLLPNGQLAIDVVLLNWAELHYDQAPILDEQIRVFHAKPDAPTPPHWLQTQGETQIIIGDGGTRIVVKGSEKPEHYAIPQKTDDKIFVASGSQGPRLHPRIVPWLPGDLRNDDQQADYLIISHPRLKASIKPLAQHHRDSGMSVKVVDIRHIYNSFNYGVPHPKAIKNFVSHAYHKWQKPAPRFVLLVGDASWDTKNSQVHDARYSDAAQHRPNATSFTKIQSTAYDDQTGKNQRNLIPTANFFDSTGHSASDNYFVAVAGDDLYPDLAIGRFPVTKPEEVADIVAKTIAYNQSAPVGPWRREILMITNEEEVYQRRTEMLARDFLPRDRNVTKIYPDSKEKSNAHHTQNILDTMNQGQNLIYFYGHGGRFIWRTGPPDIKKNHDLFTLDDLDRLAPNPRLPIVLSFTCYSAPFNHPGADSIGEKFLRLKQRGAIAFIGASWRNVPKYSLQKALLKSFHQGGTIGEALVKGKKELKNLTLVATYNLLGDPAVQMLPSPQPLELVLVEETADAWLLSSRSQNEPFSSQGIARVKYPDGTSGEEIAFQVDGPEFSVRLPKPTYTNQAMFGWEVYIWDDTKGKDWQGILKASSVGVLDTASQP